MATLYISPAGAGLRDGSSLANAAPLSSLSAMISKAGPGGEVLLIADQGAYHPTGAISISAGGTSSAPVTIRGIDSDGDPMRAEIIGTRAADWEPGKADGSELFRLISGANNLIFEDMSISNVGNGAFRIGADIQNITIRDIDATNMTRFVENYVSGTNTTASVNGLTIQNVTIDEFSRGAVRLQYNSSNIVMENVDADSAKQDGGMYIFGVHLDDTVHNVRMTNVSMDNNYGNGGSSEYWNGDGFTTERGVYNVVFENCSASGNTDAGFDLKSTNTTLIGCVADGNNRNYRFWSTTITMEDSISRDPTHYGGSASKAHVWFATNAKATIDNFTYSDSGNPVTLFDMSAGGVKLYLEDTVVRDAYTSLIKWGSGSDIDYLTSSDTPAAPTDIALSGGTVLENSAAGTVVGTLSAIDPNGGIHTFSATGGATSMFEIVGNQIRVKSGASLDYENQQSYALTVKATDSTGLSYSESLTLKVGNVDEGSGGSSGGGTTTPPPTTSFTGGSGNDTLSGSAGNDTMKGAGGNDTIYGNGGNDAIYGDSGTDKVYGGDGGDLVYGGTSNDAIYGDAGDDHLRGDDGNDKLIGGAGNDKLVGNRDNDTMLGGTGDDNYSVTSDGDVVTELANEGTDTVRAQISYTLGNNVENLVLEGTSALKGSGNSLNNVITGNSAANMLTGAGGSDRLDGGAGNDTLNGGEGNDSYVLSRGSGQDIIVNGDSGGFDKLLFGSNITEDQLWFSRSGDNLVVRILGTSDKATIQGWYTDTDNRLDVFQLVDGTHLDTANVQSLVNAMSGITPPSSLSSLSSTQQQLLSSAIDNAWDTV